MDIFDKWFKKIQFIESIQPLKDFENSNRKLQDTLTDIELEMIVFALDKFENNRTQAARYLGISRELLIHKIKKHGL